MLSPADADLIRRDADLTALAEILDPGAFVTTLRSAWPSLITDDAAIQYIRYKPGTSCLIGYRVWVGQRNLDVAATAYPPNSDSKTDKARERTPINTPFGSARFVAPKRGLVINLFPADDKLAALERFVDSADQSKLLQRLLSKHPELWPAQVEQVRYKPERRYVARLSVASEPRAVVKVYAENGYAAARDNARAFHSTSEVRCPIRMGRSNRHRTVASEWLPGRLLFDELSHAHVTSDQLEHVGTALAALHSQEPHMAMARRTRSEEATIFRPLASWLGFVQPTLAYEANRIAELLATEILALPLADQPLHGDFYAKQVLLDGTTVGIIDFDEAFCGDPAHDVGLFMAHLERDVTRGLASNAAAVRHRVLCGYERFTKRPLRNVDLYTAAGLLRLAPHPFRNRESDWPERTAALLELASSLLEAHTNAKRRPVVRS